MIQHDIVIIGGGPAGMAAAVAAYDSGARDVVILDREAELGGILRQCIHNGFGLHKLGRELTGPEYAAIYRDMVLERGIKVYYDTMVTSVGADKTVVAQNRDGILKIKAKAIILAMGCRERSRGALNIPGTRPAGVYSAGTAQRLINCDGYAVGKRVVILGSGDIGLIMARRMSLEGAKVEAVCEIMPYSGGLTRNIVQCLEDFGIPLYLSHTVTNVIGKNALEGVVLSEVGPDMKPIPGTEKYFECDTLLLSVGLVPENELTRSAGIELDPRTRGASVGEDMQTAESGVFACGNVLHVHDLVDYVSAESERAGASAAKYVLGGCAEAENTSLPVKNGVDISYTVPQRINVANVEKSVDIFMRVRKKMEAADIVVESDGEKIASFPRKFLAPAEMQKITLPKVLLERARGSITVYAAEREEVSE